MYLEQLIFLIAQEKKLLPQHLKLLTTSVGHNSYEHVNLIVF